VNFTEIVTAVTDRLNLSSAEATTRIGTEVNAHYKEVTSSLGLQVARRVIGVSATASLGSANLTFTGIEKIERVVDDSSGTVRELDEVSMAEIRNEAPGTATPTKYAIERMYPGSVKIRVNVVAQDEYTLKADGLETAETLSGVLVPQFSTDYHDILVKMTLADEYRKLEKPVLAREEEAKAEKRLSELRLFIAKGRMVTRQGQLVGGSAAFQGGAGGGGTAPNGSSSYEQTGLVTFNRGTSAPFAVSNTSAAKVANLDADKLDGQDGSYYLDRANHTGVVSVTAISPVATDRLVGRDTAGSGAAEEITVGNGLAFTGSGGIGIAASGVTTARIGDDQVTYAKIQNVSAASRLLGRGSAAGSGDVEEITPGTGLTLSGTTLSVTAAANQSANQVYAGPSSGSAAAPAFRALVAADLPVGTVRVLSRLTPTVGVSNSTTETTVLSYTMPGGTMGATGLLRITIQGSVVNTTGSAQNFSLNTKLGGSTVTGGTVSVANNQTYEFRAVVLIQNQNSASSQKLSGLVTYQHTGAATSWLNDANQRTYMSGGTLTINTASDAAVVITGQLGAASASLSFTVYSATVELV
jgi:hypothetical protein